MSKKVIVLLADGFEEVEAITPVDYLRRAGLEVTTASIGADKTVKGARGISVTADAMFSDVKRNSWDAVVIPGGIPGAPNIAADKDVGVFIKGMADSEKFVCAVCAAPALVLFPLGVLDGKDFTCYPGMEEKVSGAKWSELDVVISGNVITSRGAGTAAAWSFAIIAKLLDEATADKIAKAVLY